MSIGRKVETVNDSAIEASARARNGNRLIAAGRLTTPDVPIKIKLLHMPTGQIGEYWTIDAREILAADDTEYQAADDTARDVLSGAMARDYRKPEPHVR